MRLLSELLVWREGSIRRRSCLESLPRRLGPSSSAPVTTCSLAAASSPQCPHAALGTRKTNNVPSGPISLSSNHVLAVSSSLRPANLQPYPCLGLRWILSIRTVVAMVTPSDKPRNRFPPGEFISHALDHLPAPGPGAPPQTVDIDGGHLWGRFRVTFVVRRNPRAGIASWYWAMERGEQTGLPASE